MAVGLRIRAFNPRFDAGYADRFSAIPVACISDAMNRLFAAGTSLRPVGKAIMCGPAVTVKVPPGDNLFAQKALTSAGPGCVLVIDAGHQLTNAIIGERLATIAVDRGIGGIIVNGAVRDTDALRALPIAIFAAGTTHRGPYKNGPGEINYPVAIEGMVIESGDLIVGDQDGFVCVAADDVAEVCIAAERKFEKEKQTLPIEGDKNWIDVKLAELGCVIPEKKL
ncbi:RraA family protein [Ensifer sp. ENS05]|nr:RraA family protein [Ensifer sp. ENS05]